jgi:hypothetical protein
MGGGVHGKQFHLSSPPEAPGVLEQPDVGVAPHARVARETTNTKPAAPSSHTFLSDVHAIKHNVTEKVAQVCVASL